MVMRMHPKKKNDTRWIYVKPDRALGVGDIKDRSKLSSRRQQGWDYESFPALTASEKTDIMEKAKEKQLEAELYLSNIRGYVAYLSCFRSGLVGTWGTWNWGSTVGAAFFFWRVAVYFNLWQCMRWTAEKLEDGHNLLLEVDDFRGYLFDLYEDGKFEIPIMIFAALVAVGPSPLRCFEQRPSPLLASGTPPGSDIDSDGGAKHSAAGASDESEPAKEMQEMTGGVPSVASEPSMDIHVDRMIDRLKRFGDTISADKASPGCEPLQDASSSAATAGSTTCPAIDLGAKETLEGAGVSLEPLREALRDPRERLLANLSKILLVQTYGKHGSMVKFATDWARLEELNRNHIGREIMLHCMALDRMLEASPEFIQTAGREILRAGVYALKRAFKDVAGIKDWKQPRGSGANKWKSKVRWDLASELDWRSLTEGEEAHPGVERDLTARLQHKDLFQKYLQKGGSDAAKEEDE
ncbi:unnamed protein product [Prorocentrum cordatum]|uniref:Uncharacterized protein n=1 Tax=Prorocentrum cordatum TaxID=2364126 RepID=A0ABN9VWL6_9DINO|nr:unnamed protein product [Polarella glacialis]